MSRPNLPIDILISVRSSHGDRINGETGEDIHYRYAKSNLNILIYPTRFSEDNYRVTHAVQFTTVEIVAFTSLAYVFGKIAEGFLKEIGTDIYKAIKKNSFADHKMEDRLGITDLISEIATLNVLHAYNKYQTFLVTSKVGTDHAVIKIKLSQEDFEADDRFVRIRGSIDIKLEKLSSENDFPLIAFKARRKIDNEYYDDLFPVVYDIVSSKIELLLNDWKRIQSDIDRFNLGKPGNPYSNDGDGTFHLIENDRGRWSISLMREDGSYPRTER